MGFYDNVIVPYCIELTCGIKDLVPQRIKAAQGLRGEVLELGFGSGLNLPYLPREVTRVVGVDPSGRARKIGDKRIVAASCQVDCVQSSAERLDLPDASMDSALCTFTLCSIDDPLAALREARRVLKPGAALHFVEHGRAPDLGVARWQDRLNPLQRAVAGGCNLNRDIPRLLRDAGFVIERLDSGYLSGAPRTHAYLHNGVATVA